MTRRAVLAIDQGTTNTKVLLLDERGAVAARASEPVDVAFPQPGWVEQDALAIWRTVERAIAACLKLAPGDVEPVAVAVSNQRESAVAWDRATGQPLGPCITWQCRRTAPFCETLRRGGAGETIARKTGLTIDPLFSASKFRWLLDHIDQGAARAAAGAICLGNVDSWVLWNLTGGLRQGSGQGAEHATDLTNASRTQLLNLETQRWDPELCALFGIPEAALPELHPSSHVFGHTAEGGPVGARLPVASLIGDSHAALFGHGNFQTGVVKATYGTGSSLMSLTDSPVRSTAGLSTTVAWAFPDRARFALEGNITTTGGGVDWLGRLLGAADGAAGIAAMADTVRDSDGVYLVPAFAGLGAPHWNDRARGLITGLTGGTTPAHLARAVIESIAFQVRDVFDAMERDVAQPLPALLADGGASRNDTLMQFQADILGRPVIRSGSVDLSACGAAWLAGLAIGLWPGPDAVAALATHADRFEPVMPASERSAREAAWQDAVRRAQ
jgi:glycerol kinase